MDFMHILGPKEAIWNTIFSVFERRWGPQTSRGPGKLNPPPSRRAWASPLTAACVPVVTHRDGSTSPVRHPPAIRGPRRRERRERCLRGRQIRGRPGNVMPHRARQRTCKGERVVVVDGKSAGGRRASILLVVDVDDAPSRTLAISLSPPTRHPPKTTSSSTSSSLIRRL